MQHISPQQLAEHLQDQSPYLLDVRESWEFEYCHITGSNLIPLGQLPNRLNELEPDQHIVVICHHGYRSRQAGLYLQQQGFSRITNLDTGIDGWARSVDKDMPTY
ncbi:MAG: rhodanese-like domain-containing protein [Pseudomonadota bacterium]